MHDIPTIGSDSVNSAGPVFYDERLQERFAAEGVVKLPILEGDAVQELRTFFSGLNLGNESGAGFNASQASVDPSLRAAAHAKLVEVCMPRVQQLIINRKAGLASYMVKDPGGYALPPHQDFSSSGDEPRHPSVICWIPLSDVDRHNGGLGFIPCSHTWFKNVRGFPYHLKHTAVRQHAARIVPYMNIEPIKAGYGAVFDSRIIHGSLSNFTTSPRIAVSLVLFPDKEPLVLYFYKPDSDLRVVMKYEVEDDFFVRYNNAALTELYHQGACPDGRLLEEVLVADPEQMSWEKLKQQLEEAGRKPDPWIRDHQQPL